MMKTSLTAIKSTIRPFYWSLFFFTFVLLLGFFPFVSAAQTKPELQPNITPEERAWAENLEHAAVRGDAEAQFNLSQAYMAGHVFKQNFFETAKWLRAAANQGHPDSQANLGGLYYLGKGVARDYSQAAYWSQKAADQGNVRGEYNLGLMYALGQGVKKSNEQAVHWYLKAAEQGHQVAAYDVGIAYWYGMGIQQDQVKGYMWLLLASRFGWPQSKNTLANLGGRMDPSKIREARKQTNAWIRNHPEVKPVPL